MFGIGSSCLPCFFGTESVDSGRRLRGIPQPGPDLCSNKSISGTHPDMAATARPTSRLPHGFSVYQPTLGAPLQFLPALGSPELDDLINAFIPGPCPTGEKRTAVALDFFEHAQLTGQSFKFYPVRSAPSAAASPPAASPSVYSIGSSSTGVSPLASSWDWSAISTPPMASSWRRVSSQRQRRRASPKTSHLPARMQPTRPADLPQLPGMKILTKDGVDVTDMASRGSKSKEQRHHAHLMRIIKACDTCRRKKVRCDPSHRKRAAAAQGAPRTSTPEPTRKARTVAPEVPLPGPSPSTAPNPDALFPEASSSPGPDSPFSVTGLEDLDPAALDHDPLDDFLQFPDTDTFDFDSVLDYHRPHCSSSSSASPSRSATATPASQQDTGATPASEFASSDSQATSSKLPCLENVASSIDYTDFNLYSPSSTFSEDERMLPLGSRSRDLPPDLTEHVLSDCPPPSFGTVETRETVRQGNLGESPDALPLGIVNDLGGQTVAHSGRSGVGSSQLPTTATASLGDARNESWRGTQPATHSEPASPPGTRGPSRTSILAGDGAPGRGLTLANVPSTECVDQSGQATPDVRRSVPPAASGCCYTESSASQNPSAEQGPPAESERPTADATSGEADMETPIGAHRNHVVASPEPSGGSESRPSSPSRAASSCAHDSCRSSARESPLRYTKTLRQMAESPLRYAKTLRQMAPTGSGLTDRPGRDGSLRSWPDDHNPVIDCSPATANEAPCTPCKGAQAAAGRWSPRKDCGDEPLRLPGSVGARHVPALGPPFLDALVLNERADAVQDCEPAASCSLRTGDAKMESPPAGPCFDGQNIAAGRTARAGRSHTWTSNMNMATKGVAGMAARAEPSTTASWASCNAEVTVVRAVFRIAEVCRAAVLGLLPSGTTLAGDGGAGAPSQDVKQRRGLLDWSRRRVSLGLGSRVCREALTGRVPASRRVM